MIAAVVLVRGPRAPAARRMLRRVAWIGACVALSCGRVTETIGGDVASVGVTPPTSTITVGSQLPLQASVQDAEGRAVTGASIFWSVRDPSIASVSPQGVVTGLAVGATQVAASAGGRSAVAAITVQRVPVSSVVIRPKTAEVTAGGRVQFAATAYDASQAALTDRAIAWTSSNEALATVDASTGLVTALGPGVVTITATAEGRSDAATLTITRAPVARVDVTPDPLAMSVGQSTQLTVTPRDAGGLALAGRAATWASSNTAVASVSDQGVVTAASAGTATITATVEGKTGSATITVSEFAVGSVSVAPSSSTLTPRASVQLTATVRDVTGAVATNRMVAWSSSNPAVATVSPSGLVTAVAVGSATITATSEGKSGSASVTVVAATVGSVEVSPATATVLVQQTVALTVTLKDPEGFVLTGRAVAFSSSDPSVASVSQAGVVTGVAPGAATITAASEGKSGTAAVTVNAIPVAPVAGVAVSPSTVSIVQGGTAPLTATATDAAGNTLTGRSVTWTTSASSVATVSATGVVTAVAPGTATITATSEGKSGTATVTVTPAPVAAVTVTPATASVVVLGTVTLVATTTDASGNVLTGRVVAWSSSNPLVATVSQSGVVTGVLPGSVSVIATSEGKADTATVTVTAVPVGSVTVSPAAASIASGTTTTLTATVKDANGAVVTDRAVTWSSSNTAVASVSSTGVVTGALVGTATITATSEGKSGTSTITVTPGSVATVTVSPATDTIKVGQSTTLKATAVDAAGNTVTNATFSWSSSSSTVASVTINGSSSAVVSGNKQGSATITATTGGKSGAATVTVTK